MTDAAPMAYIEFCDAPVKAEAPAEAEAAATAEA
jgi:hypothetical protein